jgi:parvulin-like peptidyl-prolyl isomerase
MMTKMRENMPLIMWILVGAFLATIVFSWGMGGFKSQGQLDGVVGRVGNREILYDQYNRLVQDRVAQERQKDDQKTPQIDDAKIRQFRKEVWDDLVRSELMANYQQKWGVVTSDNEVAFAVRNNPPQWIQSNENFQSNGNFDPAKWEQFLKDSRSAQVLVAIEKEYRENIGNQKVIDRIIAPVFVSPTEIWDEYVATTRKFKAAGVTFGLRNFPVDSNTITASEIEAYYTKNSNNYENPEKRKLSYVVVPVVATRDDSSRIVETAVEALNRIKAGEEFAALAQEYSEDPGSAAQGGDVGYFTKGRMVKEFDSTAFATQPGQLAGPVVTRFGVHIIKVVDRKAGAEGDSVRASHILIKWKVGNETEERAGQKAKDFADAAKTEGFTKAAAQFSLEVKETDLFAKTPSGSVPGFGALMPIMDFAFASKIGALSHVAKTKMRNDDVYAVFQVKSISPKGVTPLADVSNAIRGILVKKKQEDLALEAAKRFRAKVNDAQSFLTAAARESLKVDTTADQLQRDFTRIFGSDEKIGKMMFDLQPGQVSQAVSNNRGAYVIVLISKTEADQAGYQAQVNDLRERLRRQKQNNVYADWLAQAEKAIKVVDNRYLYYTDY